VSTALEDGRYAMECVRARLAGRPCPSVGPCFFNPQHGPSAVDVEWRPTAVRRASSRRAPPTPERVEAGYAPDAREVMVGGQRRPYWDGRPGLGSVPAATTPATAWAACSPDPRRTMLGSALTPPASGSPSGAATTRGTTRAWTRVAAPRLRRGLRRGGFGGG
jgi:hypothetical protein